MATLSHVHKCVFIHIPKCAGTTISRYLLNCASAFHHSDPKFSHIPRPRMAEIVNMHPEYFRFTFVRNPYDRFVSYYLQGMRLQQSKGYRFYHNIQECAEFTAEVRECADLEKFKSPRFGTVLLKKGFGDWARRHSRRQKDFLLEHNPEMYLGMKRTDGKPLSFIGRLENFDEDFLHVRNILRLPRVPVLRRNVSKNRDHYSEYYDAAARRRVEELYAEDLEILGYDYEQKGVVRSLPPLYDLKKAEQCAPEFSRGERRILFLRAIYFRTLWALHPLLPTSLWKCLPTSWRALLLSIFLLKIR